MIDTYVHDFSRDNELFANVNWEGSHVRTTVL